MKCLVLVAQSLQNVDGVGRARLVHLHRLEPALESSILLKVFAVLIERGRSNGLELTPGEHRLENAGRVDRALGSTCPDEGVNLVDEHDDVAAVADFLGDLLQALLKVTAIPGAGNQ